MIIGPLQRRQVRRDFGSRRFEVHHAGVRQADMRGRMVGRCAQRLLGVERHLRLARLRTRNGRHEPVTAPGDVLDEG